MASMVESLHDIHRRFPSKMLKGSASGSEVSGGGGLTFLERAFHLHT
jgi:hypothetical protein